MLAFRVLYALAAAAAAFANPLSPRQTTNTNVAIHNIVSNLDVAIHSISPTILTMEANHTATDGTIGTQANALITAFTTAQTQLAATAVSSGSTTVTPTNDDISIIYADLMQIVATSLSGLTTATVPSFTSIIGRLDPSVSAATNQLNTTLPGSIKLVHTLMLDAQQFFVKEGTFPQTLAALGF
ncbi:hypothetical protein DXG01_009586 [Tephrocybe rancida]|nr:hypothetical protein DXG01_009586 [Tephrocybe rancida]